MDIYYILLGVAAVVSALNGSRSTKALHLAVQELRAELHDHRTRIERLEGRVLQ